MNAQAHNRYSVVFSQTGYFQPIRPRHTKFRNSRYGLNYHKEPEGKNINYTIVSTERRCTVSTCIYASCSEDKSIIKEISLSNTNKNQQTKTKKKKPKVVKCSQQEYLVFGRLGLISDFFFKFLEWSQCSYRTRKQKIET